MNKTNFYFAPCGSAEFQANLRKELLEISAEVEKTLGKNLVSLLLGGGYGRGEGAVFIQPDGQERLYNDLDLFIIVNSRRTIKNKLTDISGRYAQKLGIHTDFSKPLLYKELQKLPRHLMWHDLWHGHYTLYGPENILSTVSPPAINENPPEIEALKLLLNRGTGLLMTQRIRRNKLAEPDFDFIRRNVFKCILGIGDSVLINHRLYDSRILKRQKNMDILAQQKLKPAEFSALYDLYQKAVIFKFEPHKIPENAITDKLLQQVTELWIKILLYTEQHRTKRKWKTIKDYCNDHFIREKMLHDNGLNLLKNIIHNLRSGCISRLYPREKLYRSLPELLLSENLSEKKYHSYLAIWEKFN
jgi:hypothetical protein